MTSSPVCAVASLPLLLVMFAGALPAQRLRSAAIGSSDSALYAPLRAPARLDALRSTGLEGGSAARASVSRRSVAGTVGGAVVGAFLGYFASQVVKSDWDADAGSEDNNRRAFAIGGAALGAVTGYALMRGRPAVTDDDRTPRPAGGSTYERSMVLRPEIDESGANNVYELLRVRRPHWLTTRGSNTLREEGRVVGYEGQQPIVEAPSDARIVVYLDQARLGGIERLAEIPTSSITAVHFLDARAASYRFGTGHDHGAIVVLTH